MDIATAMFQEKCLTLNAYQKEKGYQGPNLHLKRQAKYPRETNKQIKAKDSRKKEIITIKSEYN